MCVVSSLSSLLQITNVSLNASVYYIYMLKYLLGLVFCPPLCLCPTVHSPTAQLLHASHCSSVQSECTGTPVQQQPWRHAGQHHLLRHLHPHRPTPPVTTATSSAEERSLSRVTTATSQRRYEMGSQLAAFYVGDAPYIVQYCHIFPY